MTMSLSGDRLEEGWYLMSTADLELELRRRRGEDNVPVSGAVRLTVEEALAHRNAGNLADARGRRLRLVLLIENPEDLVDLGARRLLFEPDYHDPPTWRTPGSTPVNVVPLRERGSPDTRRSGPWWEDPDMAAMENEWSGGGRVGGVAIPADFRGFVYKTILSLRAARRPVTPETIADSVARWLSPADADRIRVALREANDS
jgi:hypothetical protein